MASPNPFVSTQKATDSLPAVLHPIVLLSISDHITRHALRNQSGPVVGALLGQQNGRQVTLEQTFDFSVETNQHGEASISPAWFDDRLNQMRAVHKDRQLDLVGWYAVLDRTGPTADVFQVHDRILNVCAESAAILLTFHPNDLDEPSVGGKLPLTIYETNYEPDEGGAVRTALRAATKNTTAIDDSSEDREMKDASASPSGGARIVAKFLEIPYTIETEEAEMISVDFVARGVANAAATDGATTTAAAAASAATSSTAATSAAAGAASGSSRDRAVAIESGTKGKRRLVAADAPAASEDSGAPAAAGEQTAAAEGADLSAEDLEIISSLTTRANAIRMLHNRLQLLIKYLESLPASELEALGQTPAKGSSESSTGGTAPVSVSLPILRSIQALVHRLPLVVPPPVGGAFEDEQKRESNDVHLVSLLLDDLMQSISTVRQVSGKFGMVEQARLINNVRGGNGSSSMDYSSMGGLGSPMGSSGVDMLL